MMGESMMGWGWIWPILLLLGVSLLVYGTAQLARGRGSSGSVVGPGASLEAGVTARQILDERYARGEIDDEEYRRRRDELT
ncbi:SHOCT domain-containing protein [Pseudonocardia alni]|uniref:Membrane protein n=2 Tax=Pseudonocardiaceae TaxID=2070 RepID=A0A852WIV4_PSEA5|nr:SHOCT domain-containing protein [Pseudonocardia alni]NYG05486.1 putative membrane protein [Pseudonocardia antarctica]WFG47094.1 SHOCT domain-containing protein [Pseudonocardia alni]